MEQGIVEEKDGKGSNRVVSLCMECKRPYGDIMQTCLLMCGMKHFTYKSMSNFGIGGRGNK